MRRDAHVPEATDLPVSSLYKTKYPVSGCKHGRGGRRPGSRMFLVGRTKIDGRSSTNRGGRGGGGAVVLKCWRGPPIFLRAFGTTFQREVGVAGCALRVPPSLVPFLAF